MLANLDTPFLSSVHVTPAVQLLVPLFAHVQPYLLRATFPQSETNRGTFRVLKRGRFCSEISLDAESR